MLVADAQQQLRTVYRHGSVGQLVAGALWLSSAAVGTWGSKTHAIAIMVIGGAFIFPLTQLVLRVLGGPFKLPRDNPLKYLAVQIAFVVPSTLPVAGAAALHDIDWFYPAVMVIVGAHYLPFVFLYGMWQFAVLGALFMGAGMAFALYRPDRFQEPGWVAGALLVVFGVWFAVLHGANSRRVHA